MKEKTKYNISANRADQKIIEERATSLAQYIIDSKDTVRGAAKRFCISKSTVHKDMHERLKDIDINLFNKVSEIFKYHIEIRHINGGQATKIKYLKLKSI